MTKQYSIPSWIYPCFIALVTVIVWHGAVYSGFTPDDYGFFDVLSPIGSFADVIAAFWRHDPNPQYWRPMANATYSFDFLMWGWNGYAFHATNIALHATSAILVFYFTKRFFSLNNIAAFLLAAFFGISGSHDSNILWISARTDVIAAIMMMSAMLTASKAIRTDTKRYIWYGLSFFLYFLALASKEISGILLVLIPLVVWSDDISDLWKKKKKIIVIILPYLLITILFLYVRSGFTLSIDQMQPLNAEGSHSVVAFAKNFSYSIGYMIAPIGFQTASLLIGKYALYSYTVAIILLIGAIYTLIRMGDKTFFTLLYKPFVLTLISGIVAFQSFERWRIYFPSVGVLAIIAIILSAVWHNTRGKGFVKPITIGILCFFFTFHTKQSLHATAEWALASDMLRRGEKDIEDILTLHQERPIILNFLTCPTKLGGAPIMQLGRNVMLLKAEAERLHHPEFALGSLSSARGKVDIGLGVDVYALDPEKGFRSYVIKQIAEKEFEVRGDENEIGIAVNAEFNDGVARRDRILKAGEVFETDAGTVTILKAQGAMASDVKITIKDSVGLPIFFDGNVIRTIK